MANSEERKAKMLLYYITDRRGFPGAEAEQRAQLLRRLADAAQAGVDYIQLREKDLSARELERLAQEAVRVVRDSSSQTKVLINSRADVALACAADGVHLPAGELAASQVRALWMRCRAGAPLLGVSAHSSDEVGHAKAQGASFAVLAPIFEKTQSNQSGIGLEALRQACAAVRPPENMELAPQERFCVLALGGVTVSNALACIQAGADGIAGIRVFQQGDIFDTVRQLREL
jgi:thiamine-phosphate pyrophosphorylase